jgi:hypothetical protein
MTFPTRQQVSEAVRALRTEYIHKKLSPSYYEINNGQCEDFAEEVVRRLAREHGESDLLFTVETANFYRSQDDEFWDGRLLRSNYWRMEPPPGFTWDILNKIHFGTHIWVVADKRHYDSECPEGVSSFFDLPIFKRALVEYLREQGVNCPDVVTDDVVPAPLCPVVIQ